MEDRAFGATRGKDAMHMVPYQGWCQRRVRSRASKSKTGHTADFFLVLTQDDPLLHTNIEGSHRLVAR